MRKDVRAWLDVEANCISDAAPFVYKYWLDVTQDGEFIRKDIRTWLDVEANRHSEAARFVYKPWLDATQDGEYVRQDVAGWLGQFAEHPEADHVCRAWLEAKGDPEVVKIPSTKWLRLYHEKEDAGFITKALAKQHDLPIQAVLDILTWCRIYASNPDALWRLTSLGQNAISPETTVDFCITCGTVIDHCIAQRHIDATSADQLALIISSLIGMALRSPELNDTVDSLLLRLLRHPASYGARKVPFVGIQRKSYLQRVVNLLKEHKLEMTKDRDALVRFLQWVNLWEPEKKSEIRPIMNYLRRKFPDPILWDTVIDCGEMGY